jgi:sterol desaturase/sphingolipid hydroxylase (fatty acid hydroxylase superfamily)
MAIWTALQHLLVGNNPLGRFLILFVVSGLLLVIFRSFFRDRKIQPQGFRWRTFRNEACFGVINLATSVVVLGLISSTLTKHGLVVFDRSSASWWVIALEYALYFFGFDTYFYWLHRFMHLRPVYRWVHKIHHFSTSPNVLTTLSLNPLESVINGSFVPLFTALFTVHASTMALIGPTNILMGLYVHSGYEFLPRWWNKSWATKWFISATFHDQHHKYFNYNYGGYTTIWDWICGTVRPKFQADFADLRARVNAPPLPSAVAMAGNSSDR